MCDNMKEVMPMAVKNPFFKHSDNNPLVRCDGVSKMKADDMDLFDGAPGSGVPPAKFEKGKILHEIT